MARAKNDTVGTLNLKHDTSGDSDVSDVADVDTSDEVGLKHDTSVGQRNDTTYEAEAGEDAEITGLTLANIAPTLVEDAPNFRVGGTFDIAAGHVHVGSYDLDVDEELGAAIFTDGIHNNGVYVYPGASEWPVGTYIGLIFYTGYWIEDEGDPPSPVDRKWGGRTPSAASAGAIQWPTDGAAELREYVITTYYFDGAVYEYARLVFQRTDETTVVLVGAPDYSHRP